MKALLTAPTVVLVALWGSPGAAPADPAGTSPPFVDHTEWARWHGRSSLRVFPTPSGRLAAGRSSDPALADEAWAEVLALSPDADTPGMRAQFICHWQFAEVAEPGKASWNLEPWRPVVDDAEMAASGCNPGGPEERF
ncbi:hypothetical protein A5675_21915 [Mycobacterium malmoense]|uniref:DUF2599 domain-containing protein n=1 Tax=Mycobacterium malmoense TaxID=1780 RepID=A0A1B9DEA8_MYCMA|nr:DUF2599 domain-containing protein [Mycobacterium malmoense]OCB33625.1 hypothetical protein A5675_21915 [Mycobacterium malmoense]OCB63003.1 hypothetical protein A5677_11140 [Mycobacterium malmoense]